MIPLQRSSRDAWWFVLPILTFFVTALTYVSLAAHGFAPVVGDITSEASWLAPPICVLLWPVLVWYVYRLAVPVNYRIEVHAEHIVFHDSSKVDADVVLQRRDIRRFFVKPRRWWHTAEASCPVVYETCWNESIEVRRAFVSDDNANDFFEAVKRMWGSEYIPAPELPGLLSREIRLWPKSRAEADEPSDPRETSASSAVKSESTARSP